MVIEVRRLSMIRVMRRVVFLIKINQTIIVLITKDEDPVHAPIKDQVQLQNFAEVIVNQDIVAGVEDVEDTAIRDTSL